MSITIFTTQKTEVTQPLADYLMELAVNNASEGQDTVSLLLTPDALSGREYQKIAMYQEESDSWLNFRVFGFPPVGGTAVVQLEPAEIKAISGQHRGERTA